MHALLLLAHPEPASFCAALARHSQAILEAAGHTVDLADLYREGFDPVGGPHDVLVRARPDRFHYQAEQRAAVEQGHVAPELARQMARLARADLVVLHFPLWWFGVPAILKGWFDRVLAHGWAYGPGQSFATGVFQRTRALLCLTAGAPADAYGPGTRNGPLDRILFPIQHGTLAFCGMTVLPPFVAWRAARATDAERQQYLAAWATRVAGLETEPGLDFATREY